jgi:signal transduction histidine kinase
LLILVNLLVLLLPLGSIALLRILETHLLRQTEGALLSQGAVLVAVYRQALREELGDEGATYGHAANAQHLPPDEDLIPLEPNLHSIRNDPRATSPPPTMPTHSPDPRAQAAGARLGPALEHSRRTTLAGIRVVDPQGVVVGSTKGELGLSLAQREEVRRALRGEPTSLLRVRTSDQPAPPLESISRGTRVRVFVALPVLDEGRVWGAVVLSRTPLDVGKALYGFRVELLLGAALLLSICLLLSILTSRTIVLPVQALMAQAERVARGERAALKPLDDPGARELGQLSEAIVKMGSALHQRADYIQRFAADVSHEFKTPLTSIRGTTELLRDHLDDMSPQERERFLSNLDQDAQRLERLVRRLLELARADVATPGQGRADVGELCARLVERRASPRVTAPPTSGPLWAAIPDEALESVIGNLVDNALQHGGPQARVEVLARKAQGRVEVEVRDDGPGISEANLARIFDRFFTTARADGGSGLGLAIVRALVEAHGGRVSVASRPGQTRFCVSLRDADQTPGL